MKRICAWCQLNMGDTPNSAPTDQRITHGMCESCAVQFLGDEASESVKAFLDRLDVPVLITDGDVTILAANRRACEILGRDPSAISGYKGGDVLECPHARQPGGCGRQEHCKSCAIRMAVTRTHTTGEGQHLQAYQDSLTGQGTRKASITITTEKAGDLVLLRVDDLRKPARDVAPHPPSDRTQ